MLSTSCQSLTFARARTDAAVVTLPLPAALSRTYPVPHDIVQPSDRSFSAVGQPSTRSQPRTP